MKMMKKLTDTHTTATDQDDEEAFDDASHADYPYETNKEDHAKDVLDAGEVDTQYRAQLLLTKTLELPRVVTVALRDKQTTQTCVVSSRLTNILTVGPVRLYLC